MDWTFWLGTAIIAVTVLGLIWLRSHPVVIDDAVPTTTARTRAVLAQLLRDQRAGYRRSAAALRRRLNMSASDFYDLMEHLTRRGLIRVVQVRTYGQYVIRFDGYQLTAEGVSEATHRTT